VHQVAARQFVHRPRHLVDHFALLRLVADPLGIGRAERLRRLGHHADLVASAQPGHLHVKRPARHRLHRSGNGLDRRHHRAVDKTQQPGHQPDHRQSHRGHQPDDQPQRLHAALRQLALRALRRRHEGVDRDAVLLIDVFKPPSAGLRTGHVPPRDRSGQRPVKLVPEGIARRRNRVQRRAAHLGRQLGTVPKRLALTELLFQHAQPLAPRRQRRGVRQQPVGFQIGLHHVKRRRQDVGDHVAVFLILALDRPTKAHFLKARTHDHKGKGKPRHDRFRTAPATRSDTHQQIPKLYDPNRLSRPV